MKCPSRLNMISNWLYFRNVKFIVEDELIIKRTLYKGLPQGAVLSPLLYNIYTKDIADKLSTEINQGQFADDVIWNSGNNFVQRKERIEGAMDILYILS